MNKIDWVIVDGESDGWFITTRKKAESQLTKLNIPLSRIGALDRDAVNAVGDWKLREMLNGNPQYYYPVPRGARRIVRDLLQVD